MNRRRFLFSGFSLIAAPLFGASGCASNSAHRSGLESGRKVHPHILRYGFTLENPGGSALKSQVLWLYVPLRETGRQRRRTLSVSAPYGEVTDTLGNSIARIDVPQLPPYSSLVISITAELVMDDLCRQESIEAGAFLADEPLVESNSPEILTQAAKLKDADAARTAARIYEWVRNEMHYSSFVADDLGALRAMRERRGDCTEYAYLVCALARACGIPARAVGGYVVRQNTILRAEDYHNWAELYIDGCWRVVDAQRQQFLPATNSYAAFEIIASKSGNEMKGAHRYRVQGDMRVRMS